MDKITKIIYKRHHLCSACGKRYGTDLEGKREDGLCPEHSPRFEGRNTIAKRLMNKTTETCLEKDRRYKSQRLKK